MPLAWMTQRIVSLQHDLSCVSVTYCLAKQDNQCITYLHVFICHVIYLVKLANQYSFIIFYVDHSETSKYSNTAAGTAITKWIISSGLYSSNHVMSLFILLMHFLSSTFLRLVYWTQVPRLLRNNAPSRFAERTSYSSKKIVMLKNTIIYEIAIILNFDCSRNWECLKLGVVGATNLWFPYITSRCPFFLQSIFTRSLTDPYPLNRIYNCCNKSRIGSSIPIFYRSPKSTTFS